MPAAVSTKPAKRRSRYARAATPPAGQITPRDVEIVRQVMRHRFLTTQQIADRLSISAKTADHHIQHIYRKIGVSTRAAAALWATQHAVVS